MRHNCLEKDIMIVLSVKLSTVGSQAFPAVTSSIWNSLPETSSVHLFQLYSHFRITWKPFFSGPHSRTMSRKLTLLIGITSNDYYLSHFKKFWLIDWLIDWLLDHPRNLIRKAEKRKTKNNMVRQHHSVDRYGLRKSTPSTGQQKSM